MESDVLGTRKGSRKVQDSGTNAPLATVPFNPTSLITGAGGFWRMDMGVTTSSGNITAVTDQSSFGNNLANTGSVPFSSTGFNTSFPAAVYTFFNTYDLHTNGSGLSASMIWSVFILLSFSNLASGQRITSMDVGGSDNVLPAGNFSSNGGAHANFDISSGVGTGISITTGVNYLLGLVADGANMNYWLNGALDSGAGAAFSSTLGSSSAAIALGSGVGNQCSGFNCAFFGWTQKAMNSTDWGNLKTWSNTHWGTSF